MQWPSNAASAEYNTLVLDAVRAGNFDVQWGSVKTAAGGHSGEFKVFADALKIDGVRINVSAELEQQIADLLSCSLMPAKLADLTWQQRAVTLVPSPQPITSSTKGMIEHSQRIDAMLAKLSPVPAGGIIQSVGKNWLIDNDLLQHPGRAENYGWHFVGSQFGGQTWESTVTTGRLIQGRGWAHDIRHVDYSQTCVLVARDCIVDGVKKDFWSVITDSELAPLVSHQGKLLLTRQPGVPELSALYAATPEASSPFRRASYSGTDPIPTSSSPDRETDWAAVAWSGLALAATVGLFYAGMKAMDGAATKKRIEIRENPVQPARYTPKWHRNIKYVIFEMPNGRYEGIFERRDRRVIRVKGSSFTEVERKLVERIDREYAAAS